MCCIDMFHKNIATCFPPMFSLPHKISPYSTFPAFFFPKLFSLIFFFFLFIRLPLLKLLKVKNPFFISHPTPFFFSSLTHFHFHHAELSLSHISTSPSNLPCPSRCHRHRPSCSRRRHRSTLSHLSHHPLPLME